MHYLKWRRQMLMDNKIKNLSKIMIVYQMMYMSDKCTAPVGAVIKALKLQFRKVLTNQEKLFKEAEKHQIELYDKAWNLCFEPDTGQVIDIGTICSLVYESVDTEFADKIIGKKKMEKALVSYYLAKEDPRDALEVEQRSIMFAEKIIEMFDGKKEMTSFQKRMIINKQNRIIEGKDNSSWRKEYEHNEDN